jgi:hypothetical protein
VFSCGLPVVGKAAGCLKIGAAWMKRRVPRQWPARFLRRWWVYDYSLTLNTVQGSVALLHGGGTGALCDMPFGKTLGTTVPF